MNEKIIKILKQSNVDALLVTNKYDITYVSNFKGKESCVLLGENNYIIVDKRYAEQAKNQCPSFEVVLCDNNPSELIRIIKELTDAGKINSLGVDICDIRHKLYVELSGCLESQIVNLEGPFRESRSIKSEDEIQKIKKASEIADSSYYRILQMLSEGMSEKDIEIELEYTIKREGGDGYAFEPIIGSGRKSSMPYSRADKNVYLKKGNILLLNYGVEYEGYTAAISRMVSIGGADEEYKNIYSQVYEVQKVLLESIRPNMEYDELYHIFTETIKNMEHRDYFLQSIGHGRGLQTIEGYVIKPNIKRNMLPDEVYSIGISISVPGFGGARLEDVVLIKDNSVEILTDSVRNLINI